MKTIFTVAALALASLTLTSMTTPAFAAPALTAATADILAGSTAAEGNIDKRRPRVPGGSGCDSPRDLREHPECRLPVRR